MERNTTPGMSMRQSENTSIESPTHDIVAVDSDGEVLYDAEACWSETEAQNALKEYKDGLYGANVGDEVADWEIRER